jgi:hypothetical protein
MARLVKKVENQTVIQVLPAHIVHLKEQREDIEKEIEDVSGRIMHLRKKIAHEKERDVVERYFSGCELCGMEWKYKMLALELNAVKDKMRGVEE